MKSDPLQLTVRSAAGLLFASLCWLAGCANYEGAMPGQRIQSASAPHATVLMDQVVFLDRDLQAVPDSLGRSGAGKIAVEGFGATRLPSGGLRVFATFRNRTHFEQQLECRVQFFGESREPVEGPSSWQRVILPPLGVENFKLESLSTDHLAHFYVEVREAQ